MINSLLCLPEPFSYVTLKYTPWNLKIPLLWFDMTNLDLAWEPQSNQTTYLNKNMCPQDPASLMSTPCLNLPRGPLIGGMLGISSEPGM